MVIKMRNSMFSWSTPFRQDILLRTAEKYQQYIEIAWNKRSHCLNDDREKCCGLNTWFFLQYLSMIKSVSFLQPQIAVWRGEPRTTGYFKYEEHSLCLAFISLSLFSLCYSCSVFILSYAIWKIEAITVDGFPRMAAGHVPLFKGKPFKAPSLKFCQRRLCRKLNLASKGWREKVGQSLLVFTQAALCLFVKKLSQSYVIFGKPWQLRRFHFTLKKNGALLQSVPGLGQFPPAVLTKAAGEYHPLSLCFTMWKRNFLN